MACTGVAMTCGGAAGAAIGTCAMGVTGVAVVTPGIGGGGRATGGAPPIATVGCGGGPEGG